MFNSIGIYIFILVSGCVGMVPSAVLCPGAYNAVKTILPVIHPYPPPSTSPKQKEKKAVAICPDPDK